MTFVHLFLKVRMTMLYLETGKEGTAKADSHRRYLTWYFERQELSKSLLRHVPIMALKSIN